MQFKMAPNSLFAVLLRSPWWVSLLIALAVGTVAAALLPADYKGAGAVSGFPFAVIGAMAAWRQWRLPSAARVARTGEVLGALAWPVFANLLEQAFLRDGYTVQRSRRDSHDFELQRQGRCTLVAARRWKAPRTGLEVLRALQAARAEQGADAAIVISLGALTDNARPFASQQGIALWGVMELAQALRGIDLPVPTPR